MLAPSEEPIRRTNSANGRYHTQISGEQFSGTHRGVLHAPSGDVSPTGRSVRIPYIQLLRSRDGKHASFNLLANVLTPEDVSSVTPVKAPRAMLAASLYTGLRKGELCALQKRDVDLVNRRLVVGPSWNRDTTKGGTSMVIPIHSEAVPWFEQAIKVSTSHLVFPGVDGKMRSRDTKLAELLRGL